MRLHQGDIFEGCRMETNWDLRTLLGKAESGPGFSFCFPPRSVVAYVLWQKSLSSWAAGPLDWLLGAHLWLWSQQPFQLKDKQFWWRQHARWDTGLVELEDAKDTQHSAIPNPSKRCLGWGRGVLRCEGLRALSPEEGMWSQESRNRRTRARSSTCTLYFDWDLCSHFQAAEKSRCPGGLSEWPARWRAYLRNGDEG